MHASFSLHNSPSFTLATHACNVMAYWEQACLVHYRVSYWFFRFGLGYARFRLVSFGSPEVRLDLGWSRIFTWAHALVHSAVLCVFLSFYMSTRASLISCSQLPPLGEVGLKVFLLAAFSWPTVQCLLGWTKAAAVWALFSPCGLHPAGQLHRWWV
jgi:hypothetical protein